MERIKQDKLIKVSEAAHILGFKQRRKIDLLIKKGYLKVHSKSGNKQIWLSKTEVYNLPKPLPIPPTPELLNSIQSNHRKVKD